MNRKSNWESPPQYRGAKHNKRAVKSLAQMCFGLSAMATAAQPNVARKLESFGTSLTIKAASTGHNAFIQANIFAVFEDLTNLRAALFDDGNESEVEIWLNSLEANIKVLDTFLEREIDDSPLEAHFNRNIRKFIAKKSAVESIARATESSLATAQRKLSRIQLENIQDSREKIRVKRKIANLKSFIRLRIAAADTFSSIVDRLNEIEDTAKLSPGLARRVNRLIKLKPLADFYDKPMRSQQERDKLYAQLYFITQNILGASEDVNKIDNALNSIANSNKSNLQHKSVVNTKTVSKNTQEDQSRIKQYHKTKIM